MSGNNPQLEGPVTVIELWQAPNRLWQWRYLEPSSDARPLTILSNKQYESREGALRSATTAYPGVAVVERNPAADVRHARHGLAGDRLLLLALLAVAVFLLWPRRRRPRPR
jgi:hypothetical protein